MKHRTSIITAVSIAVVIAAATAAIATNLGILDTATASSNIGALTIETTEAVPSRTAAYAVGDAGVVTLNNDGVMLTILDVETNPGWTTIQILDGTSVDIGFISADGGSLQFTAELDGSGGIATVVNDLAGAATIVVTENIYEDGSSASDNSSGTYDDDDGRYENDDDRYEDDDDD